MKSIKERVAYVSNGNVKMNKDHPDFQNKFYSSIVLAYMYEMIDYPEIKNMIYEEIKKNHPNLDLSIVSDEIVEEAMDNICCRLAPNKIEFEKCTGTYKESLKDKIKNMMNTSGLSSNDRLLQQVIAKSLRHYFDTLD